jgi:Ni/Co efflux regulator RcnB
VNKARFQSILSLRRLAMALAAAATLAVAQPALADQHDHHGGGEMRGPPRSFPGWGRGGPPPGAAPWGRPPPQGAPTWDQRRYNGYWAAGRWYSGPPPSPVYQAPGFRPGFVPWRRGAYLPPQYQPYAVSDYGRYHLRRPPVGYHWVQVGDEFLLVSATTGLIFDVVTGS